MSRPPRPHGARLLALAAVTLAATGAVLGAAPLASAAPTVAPATPVVTGGAFVPVAASRVIDTRSGYGVPKAKLGPRASLTSSLAGRSGLPAAAGSMSAVVLNLTATNATAATYLTAYAGGATPPGTSSLNVPGGVTVANLVTVPVSSDGRISVVNQAGSTDVIADVVGYYATADNASYGGLQPITPGRLFDSRTQGGAFFSGDYVDLPLASTTRASTRTSPPSSPRSRRSARPTPATSRRGTGRARPPTPARSTSGPGSPWRTSSRSSAVTTPTTAPRLPPRTRASASRRTWPGPARPTCSSTSSAST